MISRRQLFNYYSKLYQGVELAGFKIPNRLVYLKLNDVCLDYGEAYYTRERLILDENLGKNPFNFLGLSNEDMQKVYSLEWLADLLHEPLNQETAGYIGYYMDCWFEAKLHSVAYESSVRVKRGLVLVRYLSVFKQLLSEHRFQQLFLMILRDYQLLSRYYRFMENNLSLQFEILIFCLLVDCLLDNRTLIQEWHLPLLVDWIKTIGINRNIMGNGNKMVTQLYYLKELLQNLTINHHLVPTILNDYITKLTYNLSVCLHDDQLFAFFAQSVPIKLNTVAKFTKVTSSTSFSHQHIPYGLHKFSLHKMNVFIDSGASFRLNNANLDSNHSFNAIEFSHERQRIIVNCGFGYLNKDWKESLQKVSAFSTLDYDDSDESQSFMHETVTDSKHIIVKSRHQINKGLVHQRHLGFYNTTEQVNSFSIIDTVHVNPSQLESVGKWRVLNYLIFRFHVHYKIKLFINNKGQVIMSLPNKKIWILEYNSELLEATIEKSVYVNGRKVEKTSQLVFVYKLNKANKSPLQLDANFVIYLKD